VSPNRRNSKIFALNSIYPTHCLQQLVVTGGVATFLLGPRSRVLFGGGEFMNERPTTYSVREGLSLLRICLVGPLPHVSPRYEAAMIRLTVLIIMQLASVPSSAADEIRGRPIITDGDTVVIAGKSIRLESIDAPETYQICLDKNGSDWTCGVAARDALTKQFGGKQWTCRTNGKKTYKRLLATCFVEGENVSQWLVREGWAMSFVRYSHLYDQYQVAAQRACAGLWAGSFHAPWDWRRRDCNTEIQGCGSVPISVREKLCGFRSVPPDPKCTIKATLRVGKCTYHLEGGHYYGALDMSGSNKRWFCSEMEASAAGCIRSKR
jgi:endonuclease YncB( thermonuclease family)